MIIMGINLNNIDIKQFPTNPGIYKMIDKDNKIIYVGKAKNLRNRLLSYFNSSKGSFQDFKTKVMVSNIFKVETIVTNSENEALILESNLIKKFRPKFNALLKDDKSYPYIAISIDEMYPRIFKTRNISNKNYKYFGPFTEEYKVNSVVRFLNHNFKLRTCRNFKFQKRSRPCLYYDIGKCSGCCSEKIDVLDYKKLVDKAIMVLNGKSMELVADLKDKMLNASKMCAFESAVVYRNQIQGIENLFQKQVVSFDVGVDCDVFGVCSIDNKTIVFVLHVRDGAMVYDNVFEFEDVLSDDLFLSEFLVQFYENRKPAKYVFLPFEILDKSMIVNWVNDKYSSKFNFLVPKKGVKFKLVEMAVNNARIQVEKIVKLDKDLEFALLELKTVLKLEKLPNRIHGFDISTIQGSDSVGSLVSFVGGKPKKNEYRRFKIKYVYEQNDFLMMKEVLKRQYLNNSLPDLILIDGGKGQLSSAVEALNELGIDGQPIISIAKKEELVYLPFKNHPVELDKMSKGNRLLQLIRDESHRFALSYHRLLRSKRALKDVNL
jgi:excinuclease ABC subunit C